MYEILVTVKDDKANELFKLIIETAKIENEKNTRNKESGIDVDESLGSLCFCPHHSNIIREKYKTDKFLINFVTTNEINEDDTAANCGKFIKFLLSSSIRLDKNYEIIKNGKLDRFDNIVSLFSYIEKIILQKSSNF